MLLTSIKYSQYKDSEKEWLLSEVEFESINLLVGKNSSGKSKTIYVINGLSTILSENNKLSFFDGHYCVTFSKSNNIYNYELKYASGLVIKEKLLINKEVVLDRDENGEGFIISSSGNKHEFKIPTDELQSNRRDEKQYPYLEDINSWAKNVRLFNFNSSLGKDFLGIQDKNKSLEIEFDLKTTHKVVDTFNRGIKKHGDEFSKKIIADFNSIGFDISDISLGSLISVGLEIVNNPNVEIVGLRVKENSLPTMTDQNDMSMGMFRALSIIIHFNYYEMERISGTVLIDDIGEGLDYERSTKLINLLISKTESNDNDIQLIMSTNDRFVMNSVDLKYWQIIDRIGGNVKYYNHKNSPKIFDEFKFTGLNNFDFFSTSFFKTGFDEENEDA